MPLDRTPVVKMGLGLGGGSGLGFKVKGLGLACGGFVGLGLSSVSFL